MDALPERQRVVLVMREVQGLSATDVCELLGVSAENQRVLLHRAGRKLGAQDRAGLITRARLTFTPTT